MLKLFTESLGAFLTSALADMEERPVVSFVLPGAVAGKNALSLFLSSMVENTDLRSSEVKYAQSEYGAVAIRPPIRLKCNYVVSVWPVSDNLVEAAFVQMRLLSAAYSVLSSVNTLPQAFIPEIIKSQDIPKPVIAISKDDLHNRPEFWTSSGCMYHPAFSLSATIALPIAEEHYEHIVKGVKTDYKINQKQRN